MALYGLQANYSELAFTHPKVWNNLNLSFEMRLIKITVEGGSMRNR